jgi:hypothetical protein
VDSATDNTTTDNHLMFGMTFPPADRVPIFSHGHEGVRRHNWDISMPPTPE